MGRILHGCFAHKFCLTYSCGLDAIDVNPITHSKHISLVHLAHDRLSEVLMPGDIAIDATVGNGHDTCFLAGAVTPVGHVYGFDIQVPAIDAAQERLSNSGCDCQVDLILAGHETMQDYIPAKFHGLVGAVMFNLGYLPGSDKQVTTRPSTTVQALESGLSLLRPGGVLSVMAYPGHLGGQVETEQVRVWMTRADSQVHEVSLGQIPEKTSAPELWMLTKGACIGEA